MTSKLKDTEASFLHDCELALINVGNQPDIASAMADYGYDSATIDEGRKLLDNAKLYYDFNKLEDSETETTRLAYHSKAAAIYDKFRKDRKKAKVVFHKDAMLQKELGIDGSIPKAWANKIAQYDKFYTTALGSDKIIAKLSRLKLDKAMLETGLQMKNEAVAARAEYYREIGESEQATKDKDAALAILDDWMDEFFMVAEIALEDQPQLMEALGKTVR